MDHVAMIDTLLDERNVNRLTPWEIEFVESCQERLDEDRDLSEQQAEKLEEVYQERIGGRR